MASRAAFIRRHLGMAGHKDEKNVSRRAFLRGMGWAPVLFVPGTPQNLLWITFFA